MILKGQAWKYGDNVDTDVMFPGRYCHLIDPKDMKEHVFEDLDKTFAKSVKPGDIVVGGSNFGCGSSRDRCDS